MQDPQAPRPTLPDMAPSHAGAPVTPDSISSDSVSADTMCADPAPPVVVIIPALDEEATIARVVAGITSAWVRHVVVCNNGSTDRTAEEAARAGAVVVDAPIRGYGRACLAGLNWCSALHPTPRAVVFVDGDGSDDPGELEAVAGPILQEAVDLVIGSRTRGRREPGALLPQARIGNWIASRWIRLFTGVAFTDLGPFRAISWPGLQRIGMADPTYGWTVEMQFKAARAGLVCREIPVTYRRRRGGASKVTGTLRGTVGASVKILECLARLSFWRP